jgi:hypothetical protein
MVKGGRAAHEAKARRSWAATSTSGERVERERSLQQHRDYTPSLARVSLADPPAPAPAPPEPRLRPGFAPRASALGP